MASRKMKTRDGVIAMLLPAIVLHLGIGLVPGTASTGNWQAVTAPAGIGLFAVDPSNAARLMAPTVAQCQNRCEQERQPCLDDCAAERAACMAEVGRPGGPLASQCAQRFVQCRNGCNTSVNTCQQRCVECPQ
jgi:hypothetical protein